MEDVKIGIIGLGYVGLPLARLFAVKYPVVGYDSNFKRVVALMNGCDSTLEVDDASLKSVLLNTNPAKTSKGLYCSSHLEDIQDCNFYIVCVPTPVDRHHSPDLTPLYKASEIVAKVIGVGDIVVFESTVYPGVTEEECVPIIERISGLEFNKDFYAGYSPERINPGDKEHTVEKIKKVTSGSTEETARQVDNIYSSVITAGTFLASSIKVAEAAKVIENSQRDINIAFVNELSKIFNLLGINTNEVLAAAATKWNFLPFKPGLVGGHCIGVDPYYLAQKAQDLGYHPEIILAGRRMNDSMSDYIASQVIKCMISKNGILLGAEILLLGFTFKENCPDVRNTKVYDLVKALSSYGTNITIYDPWANPHDVFEEYGLEIIKSLPNKRYAAVVLAVAHNEFMGIDIRSLVGEEGVVYDVKSCLAAELVDGHL